MDSFFVHTRRVSGIYRIISTYLFGNKKAGGVYAIYLKYMCVCLCFPKQILNSVLMCIGLHA